MDKFTARQPIFDRKLHIYGYELLFRSGIESLFCSGSSDHKTASVIIDSFLVVDLEALTHKKRAFINCTRNTLLNEYITLLPRESTVVEILETVKPDDEVLAACRSLKQSGYTLALDDFVFTQQIAPFIDLADIIKVDFQATTPTERKHLAHRYLSRDRMLLAEKLETMAEYKEARSLGYSLFQGYFFAQPEIISSPDIPIFRLNYLNILEQIHQIDPNLESLEDTVKHDTGLCYKLLRYLNSVYFGFRGEIRSIRHTFSLLGLDQLKKWLSLVVMASMATDKPEELMVNSIIRAHFCEALAPMVAFEGRSTDLFLMGLFSMLDAILDRPMSEVMAGIAVSDDVKAALMNGNNRFRDVFELVVSYERGDWEQFARMASKLKADEAGIPPIYFESLNRSQQFPHIIGAA
jgi:EAL and modified HD-GYP domain-containing signal transduction protein